MASKFYNAQELPNLSRALPRDIAHHSRGAMWWDNTNMGVARKTANVRTTIILSILSQVDQVKTLPAFKQKINVNRLFA